MLKIIKYLSYNKNKSKKNYIKCTKFKVSINFITNFYLLGIEKVLNFILIPKGQTGYAEKHSRRSDRRGTAIPEDRDSRRLGQTGKTGHGHGERPRFIFSNKMSYLNK